MKKKILVLIIAVIIILNLSQNVSHSAKAEDAIPIPRIMFNVK